MNGVIVAMFIWAGGPSAGLTILTGFRSLQACQMELTHVLWTTRLVMSAVPVVGEPIARCEEFGRKN